MKNIIILLFISIILLSCSEARKEVEVSYMDDVEKNKTMIYIYYPDGKVDTCKGYDLYRGDYRLWWTEDGKKMTTTLPNTTVDL